MSLSRALLATLCFAKSALSIPSQIMASSQDMNLDVSDTTPRSFSDHGFIQYLGPSANSKSQSCVGLNDNSMLSISNCTAQGPITQFVYGWRLEIFRDQNDMFAYLYTTRSTQSNPSNWQGLCVGPPKTRDQGTKKARLRVTGRLPSSRNAARDCLVKVGDTNKRILNPWWNSCLYAQERENSVSDGLTGRGDHWIGNETLVWRNCDMVKNDPRADFLLTQDVWTG